MEITVEEGVRMNIYWKLSGLFMKLARQIEHVGCYFFNKAMDAYEKKQKE